MTMQHTPHRRVVKWRYLVASILVLIAAGLLYPEQLRIPVQGASSQDWNHQTFWYEPWGRSGVHKGIDIFAKRKTPVLAASDGIVVFQGQLSLGGHVIAILGPKWRIHYYAHLHQAQVSTGSWVAAGDVIGAVGVSGNTRGKPAHLHYSVMSLIPLPWRWDNSTQGWKKIFFLDPSAMLLAL